MEKTIGFSNMKMDIYYGNKIRNSIQSLTRFLILNFNTPHYI